MGELILKQGDTVANIAWLPGKRVIILSTNRKHKLKVGQIANLFGKTYQIIEQGFIYVNEFAEEFWKEIGHDTIDDCLHHLSSFVDENVAVEYFILRELETIEKIMLAFKIGRENES